MQKLRASFCTSSWTGLVTLVILSLCMDIIAEFSIVRGFLKLLKTHKLISAFSDKVIGFVVTLPLCKALFPELTCHKQEILISKCTDISYDTNNKLADVFGICSLIEKMSPGMSTDLHYSFTTQFSVKSLEYTIQTEDSKSSLEPLIMNKNSAECNVAPALYLHLKNSMKTSVRHIFGKIHWVDHEISSVSYFCYF